MDTLLFQRRIDTERGLAVHRGYQQDDGFVYETTTLASGGRLDRRAEVVDATIDGLYGLTLRTQSLIADSLDFPPELVHQLRELRDVIEGLPTKT
jgi:hypothetical protein